MPPRPSCYPRGFTLIELMIVIAIISVLAMLVVPNLVMSRSASNETAAIGSLRAYATAQVIFKRNDTDLDGIADFADEYRELYYAQTASGEPAKLVSKNFADAGEPEAACAGYYFEDLTSCATGDYDPRYEFGLAALPAKYNRSGINTLVTDCSGVVYQRDRKTSDPMDGAYPSIETDGWTPAGQ